MSRIGWIGATAVFGLGLLFAPGCAGSDSSHAKSGLAPASVDVDQQIRAHQVILEGLGDADPQVRTNAVEVVATTAARRLIPRLQKLLTDPSVPVRFAAAVAVGDLEYALAKDDLGRLRADANPNVKIAASYAVMRLGQAEAYKDICAAVASSDQTVRANAALLLGKAGRQEGLRFLYWALQRDDSADKVALQAIESIAMLKDHRIFPKLWAQLISGYADDRVIGIRAMGALGSDEAKNALVTMLDNKIPEVVLAAAEQLGKLGEPIGEPNVLTILQRNLTAGTDTQGQERLKVFAALAIGEIGSEGLVRYLPPLLQDPSQSVRLAAAKAVLRYQRSKPAQPVRPAASVPSATPTPTRATPAPQTPPAFPGPSSTPATPPPARNRRSEPVIIDLREPQQ